MKRTILIALLFVVGIGSNAQTTNPAPYCDASFDDMQGFFVDDHINSVSFGTLNHVTNGQFAAPHYVFYNNINIPNFVVGNVYTLTVNFTTAGGCGYGVWIDYNRNNAFEASEKIAGTTGTNMLPVGVAPSITQSVTIPSTAMSGNTRMRVRIVEDDMYHLVTTSELPCNASTSASDVMDWGETEDYTINLSSAVGIDQSPELSNMVVFPNPATRTLTLLSNASGNCFYKIFDVAGKELLSARALFQMEQIDVAPLANGVYFVQLYENNQVLGHQKFMKTSE